VRVFAGGNGRKTDDTDAESIALVGLRTPGLPEVRRDELTDTLRLLSNRRAELVAQLARRRCAGPTATWSGCSPAEFPSG
jgi:hypothetical protein